MSRDIVVYTRPGCPYCFRLRRGLRRQGMPFNEVNIWQDRAAAADVRANASGNETVPTVRLGDRWLVNPTAAQVRAAAGHPDQKVRTFRMTTWERIGNAIAGVLARAGIGPIHLLTTVGRKTGLLRTNPVTLVEQDNERWLVAPYGPVSWVHNARAAGRVTLRRGRDIRDYTIRELTRAEAGSILKRYIAIATATRPYFQATKDSPVAEFVAEAHRHPVFKLTPV
jgi:glutaredoxin-like protein